MYMIVLDGHLILHHINLSPSEQINISSYCDEDPPLYIKPRKNRIAHEILDAKVRMFSFNCINKTFNIYRTHQYSQTWTKVPFLQKKWKPSTRGCWMYTCQRGRRLIDKGDPRNDYQSARLRGGCQSAVHSAWVNGGWGGGGVLRGPFACNPARIR